MTPPDLENDRALLAAIIREDNAYQRVRLIHAYYSDLDRSNRTERGVLYLHIGMLTGSAALIEMERQRLRRRLRTTTTTPSSNNGNGEYSI